MKLPALILPQLYACYLAASGKNSGELDLKFDEAEQLAVVDGFREGRRGTRRQGLSSVPNRHYLGYSSTHIGMGLWYRVDPALHAVGIEAARHGALTRLDAFRRHIPSGDWTNPAHGGYTLALTETDPAELDVPRFSAWRLNPDLGSAEVIPVDLVAEELDLLSPLNDIWPLKYLADKRIAMIGAGSIGGAAAQALVAYGIRNLALVDPDRLYSENLARHVLDPKYLGQYKVKALARQLAQRDTSLEVEALVLDVIYDADLIRPLVDEVDCVLVSSDGIDSRRVANHLSSKAGKTAVFACVLADGAFGEVLRIRPPHTGCLLCARAELRESGGMNPEPRLDRGYGAGTRHLPMTAVGSDLSFVGQLAAKAAIATLLEEGGYREQRLPGDHAIVGLQPKPDIAPPFDIEMAAELHWRGLPGSRSECPTCGKPHSD
jgi:molybdopterin/thiamine biosynthesis adenylyltransferase